MVATKTAAEVEVFSSHFFWAELRADITGD